MTSDTLLKTEFLSTDVQMKRDIDLVREILPRLEDGSVQQRQWLIDGSMEGYSNVEIWHPVKIMRVGLPFGALAVAGHWSRGTGTQVMVSNA